MKYTKFPVHKPRVLKNKKDEKSCHNFYQLPFTNTANSMDNLHNRQKVEIGRKNEIFSLLQLERVS